MDNPDLSRSLVGTWITESIGDEPVSPDVESSITFDEDGGVFGRGGVNSFRGTYAAAENEVEFGPLAVTLMAGPDDAMVHEGRLLALLAGCRPYKVDDQGLTIGGDPLGARFRPVGAEADKLIVSGSVFYPQRVALPEGTVLTVQVRDISLADAPSVLVAEQIIGVTQQVPIPFDLTVDPADLDPGHTYSPSADADLGS